MFVARSNVKLAKRDGGLRQSKPLPRCQVSGHNKRVQKTNGHMSDGSDSGGRSGDRKGGGSKSKHSDA